MTERSVDEYRDLLPAPRESEVLLREPPRYVEAGSDKLREHWHATSAVCPTCGQCLVQATSSTGERLVLAVTRRTWRIRLNGKKTGYLAERASGYPEHHCQEVAHA
jgi:hypothetical protein